jgi:MmyB-like transcription regulator ligand binding domain
VAGPLEFECQTLHIPDTGQRIIVYCAAPGSATQAAFRQLAGAVAPASAVPAGQHGLSLARSRP